MHNAPPHPELFPEIQLPPAEPKVRAKRGPRQPAQQAASATLPPEPVAAPPRADMAQVSVPADAESMARALEAHPDYRVQRRLQPRLLWPQGPSLQTKRLLVLDTETTGLDPSKDKIIELALLRVDVDLATGLPVGPVQVYDGLEDPGMPIPKEVVGITGITDADVRGQRLDDARVAQMLDGVDLVVAHNAGFDRPFVEGRIAQFQHLAWACSFADIDWKAQGKGSAKLENLAQGLGLFYDAHRAEMDCHALLAVLVTPLPVEQHTGLAHLLETVDKPVYRLQATQAPFDAKDLLKARGYRWNAEQKVWHTRLGDAQALSEECAWLKSTVYQQRSAVVQVEKLDARVKYSARAGELMRHTL